MDKISYMNRPREQKRKEEAYEDICRLFLDFCVIKEYFDIYHDDPQAKEFNDLYEELCKLIPKFSSNYIRYRMNS